MTDISLTDYQLWQRILEGDSKAWGILVQKYQPLVYAVSTRAGLSMADAADCFQQTWVLLFEHRQRLKDPSRLSAWLVTTAKREAMRLRRRADKRGEEPDNPMLMAQDLLPDEELEQLECQAQLEIALREIDLRCRKVLEAFFFAPEEKSYEEIAALYGISINSLGPIRMRCLAKLKNILIKMGYLEERKDDKRSL
jgi:RNA polymerase sigma factor (sigma-70 family)